MASIAPLVVITGPTASGKSTLALELAKQWNGEIICADSRTVYKGMDIGTAKPSLDEQRQVRHWLLDVVRPDERYTVAYFQKMANEAIADIRSRGKIPFLVGGTGLYIDAVVLKFVFDSEPDLSYREKLDNMTIDQLQSLIKSQHRLMPTNLKNKRYLIRTLEKDSVSNSVNDTIDDDTVVIAIKTPKELLQTRIKLRIDEMMKGKIVQETQQLLQAGAFKSGSLSGNIYPLVLRMINGEIDSDEVKLLTAQKDWQLARRQATWLRRHDYVEWLELDEAHEKISGLLRRFRDV